MNFFALLNVPGPRVRRIVMAQDVQQELTRLFETQYDAFCKEILDTVPLDGSYSPEPHELICIENFDDVDGISEAIAEPMSAQTLNADGPTINSIVGIFAGDLSSGHPRALLQVFDKRRSLASSGFTIIHRNDTFTKLAEPGLIFDSSITARLEGGKLCFRSLFKVRRLFDVDDYYKEATNEELVSFANHDRLAAPENFNLADIADTWIRRKITLIQASGLLDSTSAEKIQQIANTFNISLIVEGKGHEAKLALPQQKSELKAFLKFLNDDYYKSPLTDVQYVSSSKRKLPSVAQ